MSLFNMKSKEINKTLRDLDASEYERIKTRSSMRKGTRPWEVVNTTAGLDPNQPWIGLEWENGFCSRAAYEKAVDFVWASYHYVTVDAEGPGPWFGEFTFSPQNLSTFNEGTTPFHGLLNFMHDNDIRMPHSGSDLEVPEEDAVWEDPSPHPEHGPRPSPSAAWCTTCRTWHDSGSSTTSDRDRVEEYEDDEDLRSGWGIHANISTPRSRAGMTSTEQGMITAAMSSALQSLSYAERDDVFGRNPYGWCYSMSNGSERWWEFKLFRTTDDKDEIATIERSINGLVKMLEHYTDGGEDLSREQTYNTLMSGELKL